MEDQALFAVIAGTGVYKIEGMQDIKSIEIPTPYGKTSDAITLGTLGGVKCAFLCRHGVGHRLLPSEVPYKANIWALKKLGVRYLLAVSACGSLREDYKPLDLVLIDQFIDNTKSRDATFFGDGVVAHVSFADPTCRLLANVVENAIKSSLPDRKVHTKGTYLCMEGPSFSTRAESHMYRQWKADIIGMTAATEAKLAREAEMSSTVVGLVTDYDCWREEEAVVSAGSVMEVLKKNGDAVQVFVSEVIRQLNANQFASPHHDALKFSLMTDINNLSAAKKEALEPILGKYFSKN